MVTWDTIKCIDRNGNITGYVVEFNGVMTSEGVMDQTFIARGLTPGRNYTFRVAGVNINGTGPFTNSTIFSTNEEGVHIFIACRKFSSHYSALLVLHRV